MSGTSVYILLILTSVTISPNYKQIKVRTNTPITFFSRNLHVLKGTMKLSWKVKISNTI